MKNGILNISKFTVLATFFLGVTFLKSQIKEERLILEKKRVPEIKKIEKKKTSIPIIKNYPPVEKAQETVEYKITDVPALSDFKTSALEGEDIAPNLSNDYFKNYLRAGFGNYSQILLDANISHTLESKLEIGANAHVNSNNGFENIESRQSSVDLSGFLNYYTNHGKANITANFGQDNFRYYGTYVLQPSINADTKQKINQFSLNGFYDHFSNDWLNDIRLKTNFLTDYFDTSENGITLDVNLSKHHITIPLDNVNLNADLGFKIENSQTSFNVLQNNSADFFLLSAEPKVKFLKENSYLQLGSTFAFLNSKLFSNILTDNIKENKSYWFPQAELQLSASDLVKFYLGVDGGIKLNTFSSLLEENPYLLSDQMLNPTETKYHLYFGLRGDVNEQIKYDISAGLSKINNILFYKANDLYNRTITDIRNPYDYLNTFSAVYDNGSKNDVNANISYFPLDNLSLQAGFQYQFFKLDNFQKIYNKPQFTADFGAQYTALEKKLLLGMKTFFVSNRNTNYFELTQDLFTSNYNSVERTDGSLPGFVDFNLSAEYQIHKNFSIFALGNNLTGKNYETFQGYRVIGAQIVGGLKVKF